MGWSTVFQTLLSATFGALITHFFWKFRFQSERKADYYREVLENLICPFYLWLLHGRIRTKNRESTLTVPQEEKEKIIVFEKGEDKEIIEVLKKYNYLAAADQRIFEQIREFLSCYEFNYALKETREKVYNIYKNIELIYQEYSDKYKSSMGIEIKK